MLLAQAAPGNSFRDTLPLMVGVGLIMYFLIFRPQQAQAKAQATLQSALKKGDDVITTSGIIGKVFAIDDKVVTLEIMSGGKLRMLKSAVQAKVTVEPAKTADSTEAKKEEK